jgi:hypothetical protein
LQSPFPCGQASSRPGFGPDVNASFPQHRALSVFSLSLWVLNRKGKKRDLTGRLPRTYSVTYRRREGRVVCPLSGPPEWRSVGIPRSAARARSPEQRKVCSFAGLPPGQAGIGVGARGWLTPSGSNDLQRDLSHSPSTYTIPATASSGETATTIPRPEAHAQRCGCRPTAQTEHLQRRRNDPRKTRPDGAEARAASAERKDATARGWECRPATV